MSFIKKRPLGIPSYEDKLVQLAINKIITQIFEQDFIDSSLGFRPNRGCHDALRILDIYLSKRSINYVVDADIRGLFDNVDHEWLMKSLNHRIADKNLLRYISRFLKAGVMENGKFQKSYDRRSQCRNCNWKTFANMMKAYKLANPKIYVSIFELRKDISYIL